MLTGNNSSANLQSELQEKKYSTTVTNSRRLKKNSPSTSPSPCLPDETFSYINFFDMFSHQNSFTGRVKSGVSEVRNLNSFHSRHNGHLWNAILALGAIYAANIESLVSPSRRQHILSAIQYYSFAVAELRETINVQRSKAPKRQAAGGRIDGQVGILWTTLFLGLFEVRWQGQSPAPQASTTVLGICHPTFLTRAFFVF